MSFIKDTLYFFLIFISALIAIGFISGVTGFIDAQLNPDTLSNLRSLAFGIALLGTSILHRRRIKRTT